MRRLPRCARSLVALIALAAALPALPASAAPALHAKSKELPVTERAVHQRGNEAWKNGDFTLAGDAWARVLGSIPEGRGNAGIRMHLVLDAISAYREAYATTGDLEHLRTGLETYYAYFRAWKSAYGNPGIPRPVIEARHALKADLERAQEEPAPPPAPPPAGEPGSADASPSAAPGSSESDGSSDPDDDPAATTTSPADPGDETENEDAAAGPAAAVRVTGASGKDRAGVPLIAAGAVVAAMGAGASSMIAVGAVEGARAREDQAVPGYDDEQRGRIDDRGRTMNAVMIAGLVATPVLLGGGIAMVVIGAKKRQRALATASFTPMYRRGVAGVAVHGRF